MKDWKKEVADKTETSGFFLDINGTEKQQGINNKYICKLLEAIRGIEKSIK
jgi:hypothetical protein